MSENLPGHSYLEQQIEWDGKREFGLEVPSSLLSKLNNPQNKVPAIHVAGTNGKGSTCAILAAIIRAAGEKVGQFTSPHLVSVEERCLINGKPISEQALDKQLLKVKEASESLDLNPSYFEVLSAATFLEFEEENVERAVIEVGLGGRLDATNTIEAPQVSVITNIGLDHTHILGSTLAEIAGEKAGIIKPGIPVFCGILPEEAREVIEAVAKEKGASCSFLEEAELDSKLLDHLCLRGEFQRHNASLAIKVAKHLGFDEEAIKQGLETVRWPGRLELVDLECDEDVENVKVLMDCAHNIEGTAVLLHFLDQFLSKEPTKPERVVFLLAFLETKPWQEILKQYKDFTRKIYDKFGVGSQFMFASSGNASSVSVNQLKNFMQAGTIAENAAGYLARYKQVAKANTLIVASGSTYHVGQVRPEVVGGQFSTIKDDLA